MATAAVLKTDGNTRCTPNMQIDKSKPIKVHPPKIRLRLQEAKDNCEKANISTVKQSLNPVKSNEVFQLKNRKKNTENYLSETLINRNKICQMDKIVFPSATDKHIHEKPAPRCLGEQSLSYMTRNRGSMVVVGSGEGRTFADGIHIRCPTKEAEDNLLKGRGFGMMDVLQHSTDFRDDPPVARIRDEEAAEISRKHQGGSMSDLMHQDRHSYSPMVREPRCPTAEAMDTYKKSRGDSMSIVMGGKIENDDGNGTINAKKRVKDEYGNDIEPHQSSAVSQVMNSSADNSYSPQIHEPRVRLSGKENAEKNRGTLTNDIYNYNNIDPGSIVRPEPRVLRQGKEIADNSSGLKTKLLLSNYGNNIHYDKPKARITSNSHNIAIQSRGGAMRDALCPPRQAHSKRHVRSAHK